MRRATILIVGIASALVAGSPLTSVMADESFSPYVDEAGAISFPEGFRTSMVHLGSWFVPDRARAGG